MDKLVWNLRCLIMLKDVNFFHQIGLIAMFVTVFVFHSENFCPTLVLKFLPIDRGKTMLIMHKLVA